MSFLSDLIVKVNDDGRTYTLAKKLEYACKRLGKTIEVPEGFITDLASIPLLGNHRSWSRAAVIHDFLYYTNGISRLEADKVLAEAMKVLKVPFWRRALVISGLAIGGWLAWRKHRARKDDGLRSE